MKKLILIFIATILFAVPSFATTYYAASGASGSASCVDNTTNVCSLQRAVIVSAGGTNTIEAAAGTYNITTELSFDSTNTGANVTIQPASGATVTLGSSGTTAVVDIETTMVSGTITFDGINIDDGGADYSIRNNSPEVNVVFTNGSINNTDATAGNAIYFRKDTTNAISLATGEDTTTGLRAGALTNIKIAQQITVGGSNITVNRIGLFLEKVGEFVYSTGETVTVTIETDSAGAPSGTPVTNGTSNTRLAYEISNRYGCTGSACTTGAWESFNFSSNVTLTASTTYWIVLQGSYTASAVNFIRWAADSTSGGYAGGDSSTYNGTIWTPSAAGFDYLFAIDRMHNRDLTLTNSTITTRSAWAISAWADDITVSGNTGTSTAGGALNFVAAAEGVYADIIHDRILVESNTFTGGGVSASFLSGGIQTITFTYTNSVIIRNNIIDMGNLVQFKEFVKKLFIYNNTVTLTAVGSAPFFLGIEVDGIDPMEANKAPFDQVVIEKNDFTFPGTSHNHLLLLGIGSEDGILINNVFRAPNALGAGGGGWGIVVKADRWTIMGNKYYGPGPAVYLTSNHSRVMYNTFETYDAGGSNAPLLFNNHQDVIYGGKHGLPLFNFVEDNIFISNGASWVAMKHTDRTSCGTGAATQGTGRTAPFWSNRIDNNIYYARDNSNHIAIGTGTSCENVTFAEGISVASSAWASPTYTNSNSIAQYNDQSSNNSKIVLPVGIDGITYSFNTRDPNVTNKGTRANTSIGWYQPAVGPEAIGSRN